MKQGCCKQHKNHAELICLNQQCTSRLMCMICEHNHDLFTSIRMKPYINLKFFKKRVDESIDKSIKIIDNLQQGGIQKQNRMVAEYYSNIKENIGKFLDLIMNQNLALLNVTKNSNLKFLIKSRIEGNYHQLPPELFSKIREVYEGKDLQTIARQQQQASLESAYSFMKQFHQQCLNLFNKFKIQFKIKLPEIRLSSQQSTHNKINTQSYGQQSFSNKIGQKIKYTNNTEIQSLVSDAFSGKKQIITVGFDKNLRVFDKNLKIINTKQYNNILTRIQPIDQNIFAIGVSKQIHINKISHEDGYDPKQILVLKGHTQRIWDISSFNTRIIGACSEQGTKIWDLYKQKCQYTLRESVNPSCLRFMKPINKLAVAYHKHELKIYEITTMKPSISYKLSGVSLYMSQQNRNQNLLYCGGFDSNLRLFDVRLTKEVFNQNFKSEAVTTFRQCLFQQQTILIGERGGKIRIFDLRKLKTRLQWDAHPKLTNLNRPNGVVRVFQQGINELLSLGSSSNPKAVIWQIQSTQ